MKMNSIDITDEALRIIYLETATLIPHEAKDKSLDAIVSMESSLEMNESHRNRLLSKLNEVMITPSLGQLLAQKMQVLNIDNHEAGQMVKLPSTVMNELLADRIYTNNVPIVLLQNLLNSLQITFKSAEQSIRKTFDMLQSNLLEQDESYMLNPSYRKGPYVSKENLLNTFKRSDGKELFENKESLDKYLNRLNELLSS